MRRQGCHGSPLLVIGGELPQCQWPFEHLGKPGAQGCKRQDETPPHAHLGSPRCPCVYVGLSDGHLQFMNANLSVPAALSKLQRGPSLHCPGLGRSDLGI